MRGDEMHGIVQFDTEISADLIAETVRVLKNLAPDILQVRYGKTYISAGKIIPFPAAAEYWCGVWPALDVCESLAVASVEISFDGEFFGEDDTAPVKLDMEISDTGAIGLAADGGAEWLARLMLRQPIQRMETVSPVVVVR